MFGIRACLGKIFGTGNPGGGVHFGDLQSRLAALGARHLHEQALAAQQSADAFQRNLHNTYFIDQLALALTHESKLSLRVVRDIFNDERYFGLGSDGVRVRFCDIAEADGIRLHAVFLQSAAVLATLETELPDDPGQSAVQFVEAALVDSGHIRTQLHELHALRMRTQKSFLTP
jgi:hypothetical protein